MFDICLNVLQLVYYALLCMFYTMIANCFRRIFVFLLYNVNLPTCFHELYYIALFAVMHFSIVILECYL